MRVDRRTLLAGALVLAAGLAAWTYFGPAEATSTPQAAAPRPRPRPTPAAQPAAPDVPVPVRLEALTADRDQPGEARRNPFRFQPRQVAPTRPVEPPKPANETPPGPELPRAPAGPPALPAIPLKFLGILTREDGTKWAVLADGRGTFHGREGMVVGGMYQILKIGAESIELAYADGRGRQTIRLTGQ